MSASVAPVESRPAPVASATHTIVLAAIMLAVALRGATLRGAPGMTTASRVPLYLSLLAGEWLVVYAVARGCRRSGTTLGALTGGRWRTAADVARDVALALAAWGAVKLLALAWRASIPALGGAAPLRVAPLLPRTPLEIALWVALSASAGVAEEIVFRGYFQRQLAAWTGSAGAALALQAALFGVSHGYQGLDACLRITAIGAIFGALALWRRSLRPGMLAHAWTDVASGVFRL